MSKSKLYKTKKVELRDYANIELAYLLLDLLKEIETRKRANPRLLEELNKFTYTIQHDFEFETAETKTEMAKEYKRMVEHLGNRRRAKQESIIVEKIFNDMGFNPDKIIGKLGQKINNEQKYFKLEDEERIVAPKEWKEFMQIHLSAYM